MNPRDKLRVLDEFLRDIRDALRSFRRAPLVAVTIVSTLALGLGLVAVAFTLLNSFLFRVDRVPNVHEMFAVERTAVDGRPQPFTRAQFDALRRETAVFSDAYAEVPGVDVRADGRTLHATFTTDNFFHVAGVTTARGRTLTRGDDEPPAGRPVIVLSDRGWERLFARDPAVLGRTLRVNGMGLEVVGVMPEGFRGLSVVPPDFWAPLSLAGVVRAAARDASPGVGIVGRLKPGARRASPWPSCRTRSRARSGRMPMRSDRSCDSIPIPRPNRTPPVKNHRSRRDR